MELAAIGIEQKIILKYKKKNLVLINRYVTINNN